jgi:hypothetical protein
VDLGDADRDTRFDTQAEAEAERDKAVERGERSFRRLRRGRVASERHDAS